MNKNILKKAGSLLLSSIMCMSLVSFVSFSVFADDEHPDITYGEGESARTYVYDSKTGYYVRSGYRLLDQSVIRGLQNTLPSEKGMYRLEEDIVVDHGTTITDGTFDIDLNGHEINYYSENTSEYLFLFRDGGHLSCSSDSSQGKITSRNGAPLLLMYGENSSKRCSAYIKNTILDGGYDSYDTRGNSVVCLEGYSECTLYRDSVIQNGSSKNGGAVEEKDGYCQFYLTDNSCIRNCYASEGGAIYAKGRVYLRNESSISGCTALGNGGAICLEGDGFVAAYAGTISGNTCGKDGGGIYLNKTEQINNYSGALWMLSDNNEKFTVSGNKTSGGTDNNVYFANNNNMNLAEISSYYEGVADIGVTLNPDLDFEGICKYYDEDLVNPGFKSDDPKKMCCVVNGNIVLLDVPENGVAIIKGYKLLIYGGYVGVRFYFYFEDGIDPAEATLKTKDIGFDADIAKKNGHEDTYTTGAFSQDARLPEYYYCDVKVDSAYMTEDIDYDVMYNGASICSGSVSVKDYVDAILTNTKLGTYFEIVNALANYGAASQMYFGVNTDDLVNEHAYNKETVISDSEIELLNSYKNSYVAPNDYLSYYGSSMVLKGEVKSNLYFTVGNLDGIDGFKVYVDDEYYCSFKTDFLKGKNYCSISIASESYKDLFRVHTIRVEKGVGDDMETIIEMNYSAGQYFYNFYSRIDQKDAKLVELMNTLYRLNIIARTYKGGM